MTLEEVLSWTGATARGAVPRSFCSVCTDSRAISQGCLFVALRGDRFDGHAFAAEAISRGAAAVMVEPDPSVPADAPALIVPDTAAALRNMATGWRTATAAAVLGITGSAGKTTTKELAAHLLAAAGPVAKTAGNFNNDIGLPLSILAMPRGTRFGVFEAGTNHPGEMAVLASIMHPDAAILTNVGPVHIGNFGSEEKIAAEKSELLRAVSTGGPCFLDETGVHFPFLREACAGRVCITVSPVPSKTADFFVVEANPESGSFLVEDVAEAKRVRLVAPRPGSHQILDALLAVAAARRFGGVPWESISERLPTAPNAPMRWEVRQERGARWTNDAYNANPASMKAAIVAFMAAEKTAKRRLLVLGDMGELGAEFEEKLHRGVGAIVTEVSPDILICVGSKARWIADEAVVRGLPQSRIRLAADSVEAHGLLEGEVRPGDAVLLKASRSVALEKALP